MWRLNIRLIPTTYFPSSLLSVLSFNLPGVNSSAEVRKDLVPAVHRVLASLTEHVHHEAGRVVLYVPADMTKELTPAQASEIAGDSAAVLQLEAIVVQWTRQVKELMLNQDNTIDSDSLSPLQEIDVSSPCVLCCAYAVLCLCCARVLCLFHVRQYVAYILPYLTPNT